MGAVAEASPRSQAGPVESQDSQRVDAAVRFINQRTTAAGIELAREIGGYLLVTFFDGDFAAFSDPRRNKPLSFRRLLEREDLLLAPSTLYTFVRVARQLEELPKQAAERLSVSHHRALLAVKDPEEKARLARQALKEGWSKSELEKRVRARLPRSARGRPRLPACIKATSVIARALQAVVSEENPREELRRLGVNRLQATLEQIEESLIRLQWLQAVVEEAVGKTER